MHNYQNIERGEISPIKWLKTLTKICCSSVSGSSSAICMYSSPISIAMWEEGTTDGAETPVGTGAAAVEGFLEGN